MKKMSLSPRSLTIKRKQEDQKKLQEKRAKCSSENDNNFIKACEQVSKKVKEDMLNRFHVPSCLRSCEQKNPNSREKLIKMPPHAEETFNIEMRSNKWYEALQVSFLSITPTQCLSENVLKNIVEIMLNAHDDVSSEYHITYLIDKCQQVLSLNIRMYPPCSLQLHNYYLAFLTSPMDSRAKTRTNRCDYGSEKGIFNYCINRLKDELSTDSKDGPFFDKEEEIPEHVKQKVQEMHFVKSRLEIYEMLNRTDRIDRLMALMDSMAELLRFDLAFFHSRQVSDQGNRHIKLLMNKLLPPTDANAMNDTCLKIMSIFVYFVHLNYPEKYVKTMSVWINILAESLYIIGKPTFYDISDSYKPGKLCVIFAKNMYEIMADLPPESILKILERITPAHVKYSISIQHVRKLLSDSSKDNIIKILINFMENCQWNDFQETTMEIQAEAKENPKSISSENILNQLVMMCKNHNKSCSIDKKIVYLKFETDNSNFLKDRNYVMRILYVTFRAYLDTYKVHRLQKTQLQLNNESNENQLQNSKKQVVNKCSYKSIATFITMYRNIYTDLKEYFNIIKSLKSKNELPEVFYIFEKIIDLEELG